MADCRVCQALTAHIPDVVKQARANGAKPPELAFCSLCDAVYIVEPSGEIRIATDAEIEREEAKCPDFAHLRAIQRARRRARAAQYN